MKFCFNFMPLAFLCAVLHTVLEMFVPYFELIGGSIKSLTQQVYLMIYFITPTSALF